LYELSVRGFARFAASARAHTTGPRRLSKPAGISMFTSASARSSTSPNQVELQQEIQRVVSVFAERVAQTADLPADRLHEPARQQELLHRVLLYTSSALDIATGPYPEVNTLDMVVFTNLCRDALERHWIPQGLGEDGRALVAAFTKTEEELWLLAAKILDERGRAELRELIAAWQADHPDQFRVEGVRMSEFAEHAGTTATERQRRTRGALGQFRSATQTADLALLVSERAFFVAHRMPFLIRLQARLAVQETLSDSIARFEDYADRSVRRWLAYLLIAGFAGAALFWSGYFVVQRLG
jgi:hypothetical protein